MFFYFINLLTPVQLSGGLFAAMAAAAATAADFIDLCKRDQIFTHTHTQSLIGLRRRYYSFNIIYC